MTRIAACQLAPVPDDLAATAELTGDAVREAISEGADLVVLPALVTTGGVLSDPEAARAVAIAPGHGVFAAWAAACTARHGAVVVGGFCEAGDDGQLYNSAAVVDATGVRAVYRCAHLWDRERLVFAAGSAAPPVVETLHGRVGVVINYDLRFPEWTRTAALGGADVLAVPVAWPDAQPGEGGGPDGQLVAAATARLDRVAVVCADRSGPGWTGGSCVLSAGGQLLAAAGQGRSAAWADIDPEASRDKVVSGLSDLWLDRRPELYDRVTAPRS
ncbi:Predicted amidohydrolase [Quadrisphaera granulorum]|uniref:Putative amidohydrolase n=1 Tax=Quadrisphaera granulorum TaxID=317664 RepID=A0A316AC15_9ACTN|nr:nitrilase-related carbon-nitrogen hydrolase [Quadrisphaera granulorum]PWJ54580.1 putative amidohydrolase [Quadrisphaera granulorum]SZE95942.1 Predicted amidohydrolase [Quadrisphaera granulorum]